MSNLDQFIERHSPKTFSELVFADPIVKSHISQYVKAQRYGNIILYGPYGSAKSTTGRIIIEERQRFLGISSPLFYRFGGRTLVKGFEKEIENTFNMMLNSTFGGGEQPYILIDEVDQIKGELPYDLRELIDTLPSCKFIMTTNNLDDVDGGIRDRSELFEILHPSPQQWLDRALDIVAAEGCAVTKPQLLHVLTSAQSRGPCASMREILRELDRLVVSLQSSTAQTTQSSSSKTLQRMTAVNAVLSAQGLAAKKKSK